MELHLLDPIADEPLYHIAYYWLVDSPLWRQQCEAVFGTLDREEYLTNTLDKNRVDVGVFDGPEFVALITLVLRDINVYEAHFESAPHATRELVVTAAQQIAHQMFTMYDMKQVYTLTPRFNRPVLAINKAIGFRPDGVILARGTCRGKLIDWVRYVLPSPYVETT